MKKNRTNSRRNTPRPTVVYVGLAICVLSSASAIARVWRWTIDKNPPVLMELRIDEVRVNLPEFPTTQVNHRASVVWRSSWVSMEGFDQYRKIANLSSVAWKELAFTRTQQVCNPFLPRRQPWWCESPLVLDLNRDGFKLSPEGVGVYFDLTGDGDIKHVRRWGYQARSEMGISSTFSGSRKEQTMVSLLWI